MKSAALLLVCTLVFASAGCGSPVAEERIKVATDDPLAEPRSILQRYSEGQAASSEVAIFPDLVDAVRTEDPKSADVLEKGFADLKGTTGAKRKSTAKRILEELDAVK